MGFSRFPTEANRRCGSSSLTFKSTSSSARDEQDFADVETLLEEYKAVTDKITVEWVDPDRDRARYQVLADKFGIDSWLAGEVTLSQVPVVVTSGDRKWKVERHQLIVEDFESFEDADGHKLDLQSERALTGAILEVTTGEPTQVCVAKGHGEWEVGAYGDRSFDAVARELEWEKIDVEPVEIRSDDIPESCDALFVISPQRLFSADEVAIVDRYLASGGNVLLAFDPVLKKESLTPTGFEASLEERGILVGDDLVIENDPAQQLPGKPGRPVPRHEPRNASPGRHHPETRRRHARGRSPIGGRGRWERHRGALPNEPRRGRGIRPRARSEPRREGKADTAKRRAASGGLGVCRAARR